MGFLSGKPIKTDFVLKHAQTCHCTLFTGCLVVKLHFVKWQKQLKTLKLVRFYATCTAAEHMFIGFLARKPIKHMFMKPTLQKKQL